MSGEPDLRRFGEVDRLFAEALELPPAEREQFVGEQCADDPELAGAVRALLSAERDSAGLFDTPDITTAREALRELAEGTAPSEPESATEQVGSYRLSP